MTIEITPPPHPGNCVFCRLSYDSCNVGLAKTGRACCGHCKATTTHEGMQAWEAFTFEYEPQRLADPLPEPVVSEAFRPGDTDGTEV